MDQLVTTCGLGINDGDLVFVFEAVEDASGFGIGLREFRFAAEWNRCDHFFPDFASITVADWPRPLNA